MNVMLRGNVERKERCLQMVFLMAKLVVLLFLMAAVQRVSRMSNHFPLSFLSGAISFMVLQLVC